MNDKPCINDQDKLWGYFQNKYPQAFEGAKPRMDYIIGEISRKKNSPTPRVLNIGTGDGYLEEHLKRLGWDIFSLDPDDRTIRRLFKKGIKAYTGHIQRMPFDDASFDFVVASELLEHLSKEQFHLGIGEVARVINRYGWFIGTVPYCENLFLNQVVCPRCGEIFHRWGHRRSFDPKTIYDELSLLFNVVTVKRKAFVSFKGRGVAGRIKGFIRLILAKYGIEIAAPSIYFVARK